MKPNISDKDFFEFYQGADLPRPTADADESPSSGAFERGKRFSGGPALAVVVILGILAASAWLGYRIFLSPTTSDALGVALDGPREVASGNDAIYTLTISNHTKNQLEGVTVTARYPTGFSYVYASREPLNANKNYWTLEPIEPRRSVIVTIRGSLAGLANEEKNLAVVVTYRQQGVSAEFSKSTSFASRITAGGLVHRMSAPASVQPGEQFALSIQYDAFDSLPNADAASLTLTLPKEASIVSSQPQPDRDRGWSGPLLLKGLNPATKKGELTLMLVFDAKASGTFNVSSAISIGDKKESEQTALITVATGSLAATLSVNGSKTGTPLMFEKPIALALTVENTSEEAIVEGVVSLSLDSPLVNWTSLKDAHGGILSDHTITWSSREVTQLATLEPGKRITLPISLSLKQIADFRTLPDEIKSLDPFFLVSTLTAQGTLKETKLETKVLPVVIKNPIASDAAVHSSIAPVESAAGKQSARVSWMITNTLHDLDTVTFSATLPQAVAWSGNPQFEAGSVDYDEAARRVTWSINRIPRTVSSLSASFDISSSAGTWKEKISVLDAIAFEAMDKTTLSPIRIDLPAEQSETLSKN